MAYEVCASCVLDLAWPAPSRRRGAAPAILLTIRASRVLIDAEGQMTSQE